MLERLQQEVSFCAQEVPGILPPDLKPAKKPDSSSTVPSDDPGEGEGPGQPDGLVLLRYEDITMDTTADELDTTLKEEGQEVGVVTRREGCGLEGTGALMCMPERAALIKSILNFLKKAIPEPTFAENIRTCKADNTTHSLVMTPLACSLCVCSCGFISTTLSHAYCQQCRILWTFNIPPR